MNTDAGAATLKTMKIEINDRGDVQGQRLGKQETSYDGDAEWAARLAAGSAAEGDWERPEQCGHSSHHDWTKALQAALVDRGFGT